jgi:ribosomal protein S18 acetylase RimI-like enzyme
MMHLKRPFRSATIDDAGILARLVNIAGEGLPLYLWEKLAKPGESPWLVGRQRALRETGGFSYRNAAIIEHDGVAAGVLIGYGIGERPEAIGPDMPRLFVPLQELENLALDTWYVNVLAVLPEYRNLGFGAQLLDLADRIGSEVGKSGMSVIVADTNTRARRLYERCGYLERERRAMVKEDWITEGREWVLLTKAF